MRAVGMLIALAVAIGPAQAGTGTRAQTKPAVAASKGAAAGTALPTVLDPDVTKPGAFSWAPGIAPKGPVVIIVSIPEQRMHVYRNGTRIAVATISSGIAGRDTPSGSYEILQKQLMHHSNLYDDAPMPFMQRITWDGLALHAGYNPGRPASHGCIRLPKAFAEKLYGITRVGTRVIIADDLTASLDNLIHPGDQSPVDAMTGVPLPEVPAGQMPMLATAKPAKPKAAAVAADTADVPATTPAPTLAEASPVTTPVPAPEPPTRVPATATPAPGNAAPAPANPLPSGVPADPALQIQTPAKEPPPAPAPSAAT